MRNGHV